ncbi:uncharacterized protein LOC143275662 [Babylonia areolata]|uniref:uncharacterized protein LOC143275662 n=1 Tax=Babylonia areolata TaxID=304850 RepID=UPI003FD1AAE3
MASTHSLCLLLLVTSAYHVTSFAIHKRHSRSTDLGDALRMLERQRRRFGDEDGLLPSSPSSPSSSAAAQLLGERPLTLADLEPWFNAAAQQGPPPEETIDAEWLARTLGLDGGYGEGMEEEEEEEEGLPQDLPLYPQRPLPPSPVKIQPTDQELDAIFGEKTEENGGRSGMVDKKSAAGPTPAVASKKDKEVMTDMKGDPRQDPVPVPVSVPVPETRSADVIEAKTTSSETDDDDDEDDVRLTKAEFKALLKAVEKLQKQAVDKAQDEMEEAGEVLAEVKEKVAEAREQAKEEEEQEQEEEQEEEEVLTPQPQPVSKEELDNLFEDQSQEVIPTDHGGIVRTEKTLKDSEGRPVGREEEVEEVEELGPDKATLSNIEDFWYLKNYLDQEGERKKRNSKRDFIPPALSADLPALSAELPRPEVIAPPDSAQLIAAYIKKINELQTELDQTKLEAYLEDVENDILTDALNQATLAQVRGKINPEELTSLQDAIQVEEALQRVKADRLQAADIADALTDEVAQELAAAAAADAQEEEEEEEQKRGEPWRKRDDVTQAEVPVFLTGDSDDVTEDGDDDSEEETTSVALGKWLDENQPKVSLDDLLEAAAQDLGYGRPDGNLIGTPPVASLFSSKADQCPAVREFSTNCEFAGDSIDFEARALCNVHEMCYSCGESLGVGQTKCDFIYRMASTILCQRDQDCMTDAEIFLNTMKLKHRFVPYSQPVCRSQCTAEFLSIV